MLRRAAKNSQLKLICPSRSGFTVRVDLLSLRSSVTRPGKAEGRFAKWRHWHKSLLFVNEIMSGDSMQMPLCERRSVVHGRNRSSRIGGALRGVRPSCTFDSMKQSSVRESASPFPPAPRFQLARCGVAGVVSEISARLARWRWIRTETEKGVPCPETPSS
jgi:hypothetical protein